ncbi:class I SAM-dependent methyltransferase, partial [Candidatus Gracilibacteria bacterium]|nr:class I SAM-dependent methyltransferase [Candidatus Gracilibacteria bacterium]
MSQIIELTLKKLKKIGLEHEIPNITEQNAAFLKKLILERQPKHMLEIGTANGYSTLHFASVLGGESDLVTIEQAWNMHTFAVENLKNCKIKNVFAFWGDAKKILPTFRDDYFDCIYIDAMKKEYLLYFLASLRKATPDAIFVIDDVEKFRDKMEDFYQ